MLYTYAITALIAALLSAGAEQIRTHHYLEPFKSDKRKVIGLSIELDDLGKGLLGWKEVAE